MIADQCESLRNMVHLLHFSNIVILTFRQDTKKYLNHELLDQDSGLLFKMIFMTKVYFVYPNSIDRKPSHL